MVLCIREISFTSKYPHRLSSTRTMKLQSSWIRTNGPHQQTQVQTSNYATSLLRSYMNTISYHNNKGTIFDIMTLILSNVQNDHRYADKMPENTIIHKTTMTNKWRSQTYIYYVYKCHNWWYTVVWTSRDKDDNWGETNYGESGFEVPGGGVCVGMGTGWGLEAVGKLPGDVLKIKITGWRGKKFLQSICGKIILLRSWWWIHLLLNI